MYVNAVSVRSLLKSKSFLAILLICFLGLLLMVVLALLGFTQVSWIIGVVVVSLMLLVNTAILIRATVKASVLARRLHEGLERNHKLDSRAEWRNAEHHRKLLARLDATDASIRRSVKSQPTISESVIPTLDERQASSFDPEKVRREQEFEAFVVEALSLSKDRGEI